MTLRRFLPPELAGTAAALLAVTAVQRMTESAYPGAWAGSVAEGVGYYGVILWRDTRASRGAGRLRAMVAAVPGTLVEFGPAEVLDTLVVRPALLYAGPLLIGHLALGVLAGKLGADLAFYAVVLPCGWLRRRRRSGADAARAQEVPETYQ
ncbi:hypothetical protein [Actinoplanes sp. NPDC049681]|uniref:hypothetical protein n=1 Tax=Actinoplanes sp. NPDC049681 TaxID=3363905 RepID=UPI003788AFB7